jgi:exopolysaccharide biosynthesis polyprenyl glycosylphosphotransferase
MRRLLALADCVAILLAFALAVNLELLTPFATAPENALLLVPLALVLWIPLATVSGMFHVDEKRLDSSVADEMGRLLQLAAVWTWLLFLVETLIVTGPAPVTPAITLWLVSVPAILVCRSLIRRYAQRRPWYRQSAFVVGTPGDTERVCTILERHPEYGVEVARRLMIDPGNGVNRVEALIDLADNSDIDRVIFASSYEGLDERTGALRFLSEQRIKVDLVPGDSEVFKSNAELHFIEGLPLLTLPKSGQPRSTSLVKRAIDVIVAGVGLVVLSPYFAYVGLRIKIDSRGPVLFRQPRIGQDGETFNVIKFRTMCADADARKDDIRALNQRTDGMFKVENDPRITRFGAKLRRTSFDELPQLINVVRGEMSLVGPRPLIQRESDLVNEHYLARFNVRPGITGPWQVLGRSDIPFEDMLKLDYTYVTNWSVADDTKLLVRTVSAIAQGRGAY